MGGGIGLLIGLGLADAPQRRPPRAPASIFPVAYYGVACLLLSASLFIAFVFARMARTLEERLVQVEELSRRTLAQELEAKEREVARRLLEADNRRKTGELEAARELQLSLLPAELPQSPACASPPAMTTATEVGGDYYDFRVDNGVLTAALGDATGHGARAGAHGVADEGDVLDLRLGGGHPTVLPRRQLDHSRDAHGEHEHLARHRSLPRRRAGVLGGRNAAGAGLPCRREPKVDEVLVAGMPLGGIADFPYRVETVRLSAGDVVLLMSDGFFEAQDSDGVLMGYERPRAMLDEWGNLDPQEIVERLTGAAWEWGGGSALPDDVTFVVVKVGRSRWCLTRASGPTRIALWRSSSARLVSAVSCSREVPGRAPRAKTIAYDPAIDPLVNPPELFAAYDSRARRARTPPTSAASSASPTTLNPIFNVMWQDHHLHTMLYLQLVRRRADMDVEWNPEVVESVEESADHLRSWST